jgi:hypothetical protein
MTVYLAWTAAAPDTLEGPWTDVREAAPGVLLLESDETLSVVYHALKWSLPDGAALLVTAVPCTPKSRGTTPGTTTWLRERTARPGS